MAIDEDRRRYLLEAMGIRTWTPRAAIVFGAEPGDSAAPETAGDHDSVHDAMSVFSGQPNPDGAENDFPERAEERETEEERYRSLDDVPCPVTEPAVREDDRLLPATPIPGRHPCLLDWDELANRVAACTACPLHQNRTQTVFGVGNRTAEWMVIGEAPGEQEDLQGEPFVGRAGQLLNEMIRATGRKREEVYIANVLKCRPPRNRDPAPEEAAACEGYLRGQLALVKPKIILAVGRIAAQNLLKTATPIGKLRGKVHDYEQIPLVVTYHPAYLLRSPLEKRRAWEDLKLAMRIFRQHNN
jgi:uracil-DNA glycosylase family 4